MVLSAQFSQLLHQLLDSVIFLNEGLFERVDLEGLFVQLVGLLFNQLILFDEFSGELVDFELEFVQFFEWLLVADSLFSLPPGLFLFFGTQVVHKESLFVLAVSLGDVAGSFAVLELVEFLLQFMVLPSHHF